MPSRSPSPVLRACGVHAWACSLPAFLWLLMPWTVPRWLSNAALVSVFGEGGDERVLLVPAARASLLFVMGSISLWAFGYWSAGDDAGANRVMRRGAVVGKTAVFLALLAAFADGRVTALALAVGASDLALAAVVRAAGPGAADGPPREPGGVGYAAAAAALVAMAVPAAAAAHAAAVGADPLGAVRFAAAVVFEGAGAERLLGSPVATAVVAMASGMLLLVAALACWLCGDTARNDSAKAVVGLHCMFTFLSLAFGVSQGTLAAPMLAAGVVYMLAGMFFLDRWVMADGDVFPLSQRRALEEERQQQKGGRRAAEDKKRR